MTNNLRWMGWRSLVISLFIVSGSLTINSCGNARSGDGVSGSVAPAPQGSAESKANRVIADGRSNNQASDAAAKPAASMPQKPQLVKTAELSLRLESIDKMMVQLRQVVQSRQGDIYNFQDDRSQDSGKHRQATLLLKVPSALLDGTLAEIVKLGRVESQGIKSEDVTQQLVDTGARLKNLRQQEDLTRKIMERSGSVKDILAVSQELSSIRAQIEQLDATAKNLRQQVAYSTINLKVEETQSVMPTSESFGVQVQETWKNSTHAAGSLGTNLVLALLWLLPFVPFLAIGTGGVYYLLRQRRQHMATSLVAETSLEDDG
jgi:Domain of unknown function (DUF4349)